MPQFSPTPQTFHRLLRANLPLLASGEDEGHASLPPLTQHWPLTGSEAVVVLVPSVALAVSVGAWLGSVPMGMALAMALVAWGWRRAAVRFGHDLLPRVIHQMRALELRQSFGQRDALAAASDTLLVAVVGLFPTAFLLQSLTLGLQAIGSPWTMLLALLTTPISMVALVLAIFGTWRGFRTVAALGGRVLDEVC